MIDRSETLDIARKALPDLFSHDNWLPLLPKTDRALLTKSLLDKIPRFVDLAFQAILKEQQQEAIN